MITLTSFFLTHGQQLLHFSSLENRCFCDLDPGRNHIICIKRLINVLNQDSMEFMIIRINLLAVILNIIENTRNH